MTPRRRVDIERESLPWNVRTHTKIRHDCVLWEGAMTGEVKSVHRAVWQALRGPIPERALIVRVCGDARCVRPGHLALSTRSRLSRARKGDTR